MHHWELEPENCSSARVFTLFTKFQSLNFKFKFRVAEVPLALALRVKFTVTVAGWVFTGKRGKNFEAVST